MFVFALDFVPDFVSEWGKPSKRAMPTIPFSHHDTLLFIGDSITDCGRARPLGAGAGLGSGYVSLVDAALAARHPGTILRVLNAGIGGDRVIDLRERWRADVLDLKPHWISIMIGVNDVWRQFDRPEWGARQQVSPGVFKRCLQELTAALVGKVKGIFLLSPFFLEPNPNDPMRMRVDEYGEIMRGVAEERGASFVDVQAAFDRVMAKRPPQTLSTDRVHPNLAGHQVIADAFLAAVER